MLRLKYRRRILISSGAKETPHEKNRPVRGGFLSARRTSFYFNMAPIILLYPFKNSLALMGFLPASCNSIISKAP
jgi:hypothetical protein